MTKSIKRKDMELIDYECPIYLDGALSQYTVQANDYSWVAYFSDEDDAKAFLAFKSGTKVP